MSLQHIFPYEVVALSDVVLSGNLVFSTGASFSGAAASFFGSTGSTGSQGPTGSQGAQGASGSQGLQGLPGSTGSQGPQGLQGIQGNPGDMGPTGPQGVQGLQGIPGVATGYTGTQGPEGPQGIQGVPGSPGDQGPTGPQGVQGMQGISGQDGQMGPTGLQGLDGTMGPTGNDGLPGSTGPQGTPGIPGSPGIQGPTGPSGVDGSTGPAGLDGLPGTTGPSGIDGPTGPQGTPGTNGSFSGAVDNLLVSSSLNMTGTSIATFSNVKQYTNDNLFNKLSFQSQTSVSAGPSDSPVATLSLGMYPADYLVQVSSTSSLSDGSTKSYVGAFSVSQDGAGTVTSNSLYSLIASSPTLFSVNSSVKATWVLNATADTERSQSISLDITIIGNNGSMLNINSLV